MSKITKRGRTQNINLKCGVCLATLSNCITSNYNGKIQRCFFKVCCSVLKIEPQLFKAKYKSSEHRKKQQTIRFCDSCLLTLKGLNKLVRKLHAVQNCIRKIEIDLKAKILNCQKQLEVNETEETNNEVSWRYTKDRKRFRYLAVKDFLPVIELQGDNSQKIKSSQKQLTTKKNKSTTENLRIDLVTTKIEIDASETNIDIKQEEFLDILPSNTNRVITDELLLEDNDQFLLNTVANQHHSYGHSKEIGTNINQVEGGILNATCDRDVAIESPISPPADQIDSSEGPQTFSLDKGPENNSQPHAEKLDEDDDFEFPGIECSDSDSDYKPEKSDNCSVKNPAKSSKKKNSSPKKPKSTLRPTTTKQKTVSDTEVEKKKSTTNARPKIKSGRDYLKGVEYKITEGKWSYRTIEYSYDETVSLYRCGLCQRTRTSQAKLRGHIGTVHGVEGFGKWHYCGVPYNLNKETGKFECSVCKKEFIERCSVGRHIREQHKEKCKKLAKKIYFEDNMRLKCNGEKFKSRLRESPPVVLGDGMWLYRGVEIKKQPADGHFHCGVCERLRKSWHSILLHVVECHDDKSKSENECKICGMQFGTPYRLKTHMETHAETKAHQCEQCGECFKQKCSLYAHVARIHEMKRPYVCEYCAKGFYTRKDCRVHVRTHTKEKPYTCIFPGCGMSFSLRTTLKNHMNSKVHGDSEIVK